MSVFAGKGKYVLVGLKIFKLKPLLTMAASTVAYTYFYGFPYAVGFVGLIFVHECGHLIAMRHYGIPFSPMVFIPFMGASIGMEAPARDAYEEGIVALGGPVLGSLGAFATHIGAEMTGSQLLFALAEAGYMINLFNLLPIGSMDGGRVANAISPVVGGLGLVGGTALAYQGVIMNPIFYLILLGGYYSFASRVMGWQEAEPKGSHYYNIGASKTAILTALYASIVAALMLAMYENAKKKKTTAQLRYEKDRQITEGNTEPWTEDDPRYPVYDFGTDDEEW